MFSISSILKKSKNIILKNKIEKLYGKTSQKSTVFSRKKLQSKNFNQVNI
jgi:hypothetical protein